MMYRYPLFSTMASFKLLLCAALLAASTDAFAPVGSVPSTASSLSASADSCGDGMPSFIWSRRSAISTIAGITASPLLLPVSQANARLEGVNKPELLPSEPGLNVIQVEKFLTKGQEKRMNDLLTKLEADTGWRVRVLCQSYPRTPG